MQTRQTGGFGEVDQVVSLISYKVYARKRILRYALSVRGAIEGLKGFVA